jgi:hypothetical protein
MYQLHRFGPQLQGPSHTFLIASHVRMNSILRLWGDAVHADPSRYLYPNNDQKIRLLGSVLSAITKRMCESVVTGNQRHRFFKVFKGTGESLRSGCWFPLFSDDTIILSQESKLKMIYGALSGFKGIRKECTKPGLVFSRIWVRNIVRVNDYPYTHTPNDKFKAFKEVDCE